MKYKKQVDESWKESAETEKERLARLAGNQGGQGQGPQAAPGQQKQQESVPPQEGQQPRQEEAPQQPSGPSQPEPQPEASQEQEDTGELNFLNYVSSLAFQAMIFMGEVPHPATNETMKNLEQAKFLIDTLALLREKTQGNLTKQESDLLNASIYELQMKFVDVQKKEESGESEGQEGQEGSGQAQ